MRRRAVNRRTRSRAARFHRIDGKRRDRRLRPLEARRHGARHDHVPGRRAPSPQRDGDVEPVSIDNVVLDPTSPPYTLYRVTLNNDSSNYGSPAFVVRTPVVENVRDLGFVYYDDGGHVQGLLRPRFRRPSRPRRVPASLTRVNVSLVGMTRQQDFDYIDPSDPAAPRYRKFELKGDVTPRNMRLKGIQDLNADVTPPTKPATPTLIPGHCRRPDRDVGRQPASRRASRSTGSAGGRASGVVTGAPKRSGLPFFLDGLTNAATYFVTDSSARRRRGTRACRAIRRPRRRRT